MTNPEEVHRFGLLGCEITGHQHYGLVFRTDSGRPGFIDSADIFDPSQGHGDWPPVGARLICVVLGETRDGRIRASARASDIALVHEEMNPQQALSEWRRIRDAGFADPAAPAAYVASARGKAILRWALRQSVSSSDHARAIEIIAIAPESIQTEIQGSP